MVEGSGTTERTSRQRWPAAVAFAAAAVAGSLLALNHGTYDIVARQEVGLAIWWVIGLGLALGLLPRALPSRLALVPVGLLMLLAFWSLLSMGWSESDERSLAEAARVVTYCGVLVLALLTLDRRTWAYAAMGFAFAAALVAGLATGSRLFPELFPEQRVPSVIGGQRLNYPFDYWNAVGAWGAMAVAAALAWSLYAKHLAVRALWLATVPWSALAIYLTYSRAAIAGTVLGCACVLVLARRRLLLVVHLLVAGLGIAIAIAVARDDAAFARGDGGRGGTSVALVLVLAGAACALAATLAQRAGGQRWSLPRPVTRVAAGLAVVAVVGGLVTVGPALADRGWASFRDTGISVRAADPSTRLGTLKGTRYYVYSTALKSFGEAPTLGSGAGTFEFTWNRSAQTPEFLRDAHSLYLEPLSELGWPGFGLTVAFLLAALLATAQALRRVRQSFTRGAAIGVVAIFGVFLVQGGLDWMWESTAVAVLALGSLGALWTRLSARTPVRPLPIWARVSGAVACALLGLLLVPGLVSTSSIRKSQESVRRGDVRQALARANDAVAAAPWSASTYLQRALVSEAAGDLITARVDLQRAVRREPANWRFPLALARIEAERGRPGIALREFRRAKRLRPRGLVFNTSTAP